MTTTHSELVPVVGRDFDSFAVRQAIAGFLAGYGDTTREAYSLDLRQWLGWCSAHQISVLAVKRAHIELFAQLAVSHSGGGEGFDAEDAPTWFTAAATCTSTWVSTPPMTASGLLPTMVTAIPPRSNDRGGTHSPGGWTQRLRTWR